MSDLSFFDLERNSVVIQSICGAQRLGTAFVDFPAELHGAPSIGYSLMPKTRLRRIRYFHKLVCRSSTALLISRPTTPLCIGTAVAQSSALFSRFIGTSQELSVDWQCFQTRHVPLQHRES